MPTSPPSRSPARKARNVLKLDPSRTALIRRAFVADLRRRFNRVKSDVWNLIVTQDGMGLRRKGLTANAWSDEARERSAEVRRARMRHDDPQVPVLRAEAEKTFPEGTRRNEASFALAPSKWDVVLTQHVGDRLVGAASVWRDPDTAEEGVPHGQYVKVRNLATSESGRGRELMNDVIRYAAEKNAGIYLSSLGSSRWFYQKLGFHEGNGFTYYLTPDEVKERAGALTTNAWSDEARERSIEVREAKALYKQGPQSFSELAKQNGGVGSVYDVPHNFYDKVIVRLHNKSDYAAVFRFAKQHPEAFAQAQTSMRYGIWRDLKIQEPFDEWLRSGTIKVYRGYGEGSTAEGLSWTLDKHIAQGFADYGSRIGWRIGNDKDPTGKVIEKEVPISDIVLYSDAQGEKEVIIGKYKKPVKPPTTNSTKEEDEKRRKRDSNLALLALLLSSPPSQKVKQFELWLEKLLHTYLMPTGARQDPWFVKYLNDAYKKGVARSFDEAGHTPSTHPMYPVIRSTFVGTATGRPDRLDARKMAHDKANNTLKASTALIVTGLASVLAEGLKNGTSPAKLGKKMSKVIDGVFEKRAKPMAKTEVVGAQAKGQIDGAKDLGITHMEVEAEWITAGDLAVCARCAMMEGQIIPISMAEGIIPLHPNCRCSWRVVRKGTKTSPKQVNVFER